MSFRILHLSPDDKFVRLQQDLFETAFPGGNSFRILRADGGDLVHAEPADNLVAVDRAYFDSERAREDFELHDCVVCHSINSVFVSAFELIPASTLVVWSAWGFEYFHLLQERHGVAILASTAKLCRSLRWRRRLRRVVTREAWSEVAQGFRRRFAPRMVTDESGLESGAERLDVISINDADVPRLRAVLPGLTAPNHLLPYYTTEDTLAPGAPRMTGPDILLGNSATPTNNHLEALEQLRKVDLAGRRIVTPLSYGDMAYADEICRIGNKWFGSSFAPLREFMSLSDFNQVIGGCGTVIMNHVRQQAMGTISAALYKQARVFLRRQSPLFGFFHELGIHVDPVSELAETMNRSDSEQPDVLQRSSELIGDYWSRERAISQILELRRFHEDRSRLVGAHSPAEG